MSQELIKKLQNPDIYNHKVTDFKLIETHISWVILTGDFAYKIKKAVNFGFLDFSSLEKRKYFCRQELLLNKRTADEIYIDVIAITGSFSQPSLQGKGEVIEYAIKMRQFPQYKLYSQLLADNQLSIKHINDLTINLANFHLNKAEIIDKQSQFSGFSQIKQYTLQNFEQIKPLLNNANDLGKLDYLLDWTKQQLNLLKDVFNQRKKDNWVRACHGDLHLNNIVLFNDKNCLFDCIEFNDDFRLIDIASDIAFLIMDLHFEGASKFANIVLNNYIEQIGEYTALQVMSFYIVYRAMVRAKIALLSIADNCSKEQREAALSVYRSYVAVTTTHTKKAAPQLVLMHGVSTSGKSTYAKQLLKENGFIMVRSDVERKRLFDGCDIKRMYEKENIDKVYEYLLSITNKILHAGFSVVVDATFLLQSQRAPFLKMAQENKYKCSIVSCIIKLEEIKQRLDERKQQADNVSDVTWEVIEKQLSITEPFLTNETSHVKEIFVPLEK